MYRLHICPRPVDRERLQRRRPYKRQTLLNRFVVVIQAEHVTELTLSHDRSNFWYAFAADGGLAGKPTGHHWDAGTGRSHHQSPWLTGRRDVHHM